MEARSLRTALGLSWGAAGLAALASTAGLLAPQLYRDNALVRAAWTANDAVTLLLAVPLLVLSLVGTARGSHRALLVWLGLLDYVLYTYAFYLVGAAFNALFLAYAALVALALYAAVFSLPRLDVAALARGVAPGGPARAVAGYMALTVVGLGGAWTALALGFVLTGRVPGPVVETGHPTGVVFALDLTLLLPAMALGAAWLWQGRPWGVVLAVALNVKGALYTLALALGALLAHRAGVPGALAQVPVWALFTLASSTAAALLLARLRQPAAAHAPPPAASLRAAP